MDERLIPRTIRAFVRAADGGHTQPAGFLPDILNTNEDKLASNV
jgi:hypothetical protein